MTLKFAYLHSQGGGGVGRVFETLRDGLAPHGWAGERIDMTCLPEALAAATPGRRAAALRDLLSGFDAVIGNVFVTVELMNVLRYLPATQPRLMIVHSITFATYQAARALRDHVHHTVAVSPRIAEDLVARHGFRADAITVIFNAVGPEIFATRRRSTGIVGMLSLGRIEHRSKQILHLPKMLAGLDKGAYRLTVAGSGPDEAALAARLTVDGIPHRMAGWIDRAALPEILAAHELFLFPSRFEGMGIALAEAMAAGLVPVAARIRGVTDRVIAHGVNGFIFEQGDFGTARRLVATLLCDAALRTRMSSAARDRAAALFGTAGMADSYAGLLGRIDAHPVPIRPEDPSRWSVPRRMQPGLRAYFPAGLRRRLADLLMYR